MGLAQPRELIVKVCQGTLQHLAVVWVLGGLQPLKDTLAGEQQVLFLAPGYKLSRRKLGFGFVTRRYCLSLLLLYRLAFPASRHRKDYRRSASR